MPEDYKKVRYSLCSIDFDSSRGTFGNKIDTLVSASSLGKSVSFPRPSYDGKYIMYTLSDYGNFSIWHREADLWLLDLKSGESRNITEVNSPETESYHNWSSNSHWFVFSSRRDDGLYTRLYLASIDDNGNVSKPLCFLNSIRQNIIQNCYIHIMCLISLANLFAWISKKLKRA